MKYAVLALALLACKGKRVEEARDDAAPVAKPADAGPDDWAALSRFTKIEPLRIVALPARVNTPRFDVGGPAITNGIAVVASSQFGFVAVDYLQGKILWSKPTGLHVAPPVAHANTFILVGECL